MISIYGIANSNLNKILIKLCFGKEDNINTNDLIILNLAIVDDRLSGEQLRVLPLLYTNINIFKYKELSDFAKSRIKSIYKHTFYRNNIILNKANKLQKLFEHSYFKNNNLIFIKGIPSVLFNNNLGCRPMADIDILVPYLLNNQYKALELFNNHYTIKSSSIRSITLLDKDNFEYDLHWLLNDWALKQVSIDKLLKYSKHIKYNNNIYNIPCIEHHLAIVLAHGVFSANLLYDARWVIDVLAILSYIKQNNINFNIDLFSDFINDFSATSVLYKYIQQLYKELPKDLNIDYDLLYKLNIKIKKSNFIINYLYVLKPVPNIPDIIKPNKTNWIKAVIKILVLNPIIIYKNNNYSFKNIYGSILSFPVRPIYIILFELLKKIVFKLPYVFFNIYTNKINTNPK